MSLSRSLVLFLVACSGGEEGTQPTTPSVGDVVSVDISAADGGEVEAGDAALSIAPGALSEDTTITVEVLDASALPDAATLVGQAYDFGPDGTTFSVPADLTIDAGTAPPTDMAYVVSWLDEATSQWVDLPSTTSGTSVTAPVEHFTTFVIRVVDGEITTGGGECSFTACGGDPAGSWTFHDVCYLEEVEVQPWTDPNCPEATFEIIVDYTGGTWDMGTDGSWSVALDATTEVRLTYPASCAQSLFSSCADLEKRSGLYGATCTGDIAVECVCSAIEEQTLGTTGMWEANGTTIAFADDADPANPDIYEFCASASELELVYDGILEYSFTR